MRGCLGATVTADADAGGTTVAAVSLRGAALPRRVAADHDFPGNREAARRGDFLFLEQSLRLEMNPASMRLFALALECAADPLDGNR